MTLTEVTSLALCVWLLAVQAYYSKRDQELRAR